MSKLKEEIYNALPSGYRTFIAQRHGNIQEMGNDIDFPELAVTPALKEVEEVVVDTMLYSRTPQCCSFKSMTKKVMYNITVKMIHQDSLRKQKVSKWPDLLSP